VAMFAREMVTPARNVATRPRLGPRAMLVMPEHWSCVLLRATLVERGWDAACLTSLRGALFSGRPAPRVVLVDVDSIGERDKSLALALDGVAVRPRLVLLAHAFTSPLPPGHWDRVLRRPVAIDALADAILEAKDAPAAAGTERFALSLEFPWPRIRCGVCARARHYAPPRNEDEQDAVHADMLRFIVEHAH